MNCFQHELMLTHHELPVAFVEKLLIFQQLHGFAKTIKVKHYSISLFYLYNNAKALWLSDRTIRFSSVPFH